MVRVALVACAVLGVAIPAHAATLVGIVSERAAPELAAAAQRFLAGHPKQRLRLRTVEQIVSEREDEVAALWQEADAILIAGVFRDDAATLGRMLDRFPPPPHATVIAFSGDVDLTRRSRKADRRFFAGLEADVFRALTFGAASGADPVAEIEDLIVSYPQAERWLRARALYLSRGAGAWSTLIGYLLAPYDERVRVDLSVAAPQPAIRFVRGNVVSEIAPSFGGKSAIAVLDYETGGRSGDAEIHRALCESLKDIGLECFSVLARWGESTAAALKQLESVKGLSGVVVLQDFVLGGGPSREPATASLSRLDVPVWKALRLVRRGSAAWRHSDDGIPWDSVHYRVAMPELQGVSEPTVVGVAGPERRDTTTGLALSVMEPVADEVAALARRVARWQQLRTKNNADKRIALIYYNHPPGRHNIGADNLDVPASLLQLLRSLRDAGYTVGDLPENPAALLELLQTRGINVPEDRETVAAMHGRVAHLSGKDYARAFERLPTIARAAMSRGPLAALAARVEKVLADRAGDDARVVFEKRVDRTLEDVRHLLDGVVHPRRERAIALLEQLTEAIRTRLSGGGDPEKVLSLVGALSETGIEGLRGFGPPPGRGMVHAGDLLVPGIRFGNIFVGPQPPRGWELDEELLHANLAFPPPHQYLAFYTWLRERFEADALVHVGRHSTYEFLPGLRLGLPHTDFPRLMIGETPSVYLYVVDGVGEGIQAKRRGLAVIVDHLTPSMQATPLYDELLELRQLVESFETAESAGAVAAQGKAIDAIRGKVKALHLEAELQALMGPELKARGLDFDEVDDELLVHEIGHYLTGLQERFMPFGLHVFGKTWNDAAVGRMANSMASDPIERKRARQQLRNSPAAEMAAFLGALDGRYVRPGPGNDPIRNPDSLPTGRNFHALDGAVLPTRVAWALGQELAARARQERNAARDEAEAVVLWASDTVRDEGAMVAFGFALLGVEPVWNSRGILKGIARLPATQRQPRRDVSFVTSGLFRDLYENLLVWLDRAVLLALDASSNTIRRQHPELIPALDAALERSALPPSPGDEPLDVNHVAAHWVETVRGEGGEDVRAGRRASLRVFGNAPGGYGAGINRLAERSGAWNDRSELARVYLRRMGHAFGEGLQGEPAQTSFENQLKRTGRTFLGRASNLYGVLDNNDGYDYLGGLGLAIESVRGNAPRARVVRHADPKNPKVEPLEAALLSELRGRHLNPTSLKSLMEHGYAGARSMSQGFVENLWGWQVTSPQIIKSWAWDEVHSVFLEDRYAIGLDEFLEDGRNVHVLTNLEAILLVAASKGFWQPSSETLQALAESFAEHVAEHGLPGSGHTRPDHPMMSFVSTRLSEPLRERLNRRLTDAQVPKPGSDSSPSRITEIEIESTSDGPPLFVVIALALVLVIAGAIRGRRVEKAGGAHG